MPTIRLDRGDDVEKWDEKILLSKFGSTAIDSRYRMEIVTILLTEPENRTRLPHRLSTKRGQSPRNPNHDR